MNAAPEGCKRMRPPWAADAHHEGEGDREIDHPELELLVNALEAGISRAGEAVDRTEREVRATLDFYLAREQARYRGTSVTAGQAAGVTE